MKRLTGITVLLLCLLSLLTLSALAEVPEGYPAVRIDPQTGEAYDFGGRTVYLYDYWTGTSWQNITPETAEEQALYDYRCWLQDTYNVQLVQAAKGDWSSQETELERFVSNPDGTLCIYILTDAQFGQALKGNALDTWDADLTDDKWNASVVGLSESNGQTYSLSADVSEPRQMLFFNKDVLTAADVDWHEIYQLQTGDAWDWDALENILAWIHTDGGPYGITGNADELCRVAVFSNGGSFFGRDADGNLTVTADSPETLAALNWAKQIWRSYFRKQQEGETGWDYYKTAWQNGETAFYIGQAYEAQTDYFEGISWGCVAFPKGPDGTACVTVAGNNVTVLPRVYDAHTRAMLSMIYDLWTTAVPGQAQTSVPDAFVNNGDPDACATYAMLQENSHITADLTSLIGNVNDVLGPLLWELGLDDVTPEEQVDACMEQWQEACDIANGTAEAPELILRNANPVIHFYAGLPGSETAWSQNFLTDIRVTNYDEMRMFGGWPVFTVTQDGENPLDVYWNAEWDGDEVHLDVRLDGEDIPDHAMTGDLTITCTWNGKTASTVTTVEILELASQPEGIDTPKEWILDLGETFTVEPHMLPDGYTIPGYTWELVGNSGEFEKFTEEDESLATDTSRTYTATKSGIYEALVALQADTVIAGKFVIFKVKDENGNLPSENLQINETNFPDERFRAIISDYFDWNNDGELDDDEILDADQLDIYGQGGDPISLKGIELLPKLGSLQIFTPVTDLDLSGNPDLYSLSCYGCGLTALDISHNPDLDYVACYGNLFTELDVSACPILCEAVQNSQRQDYGSYDWIGGRVYVDYFVTVIAGDTVSEPLFSGQGTAGDNVPFVDIPESISLGQNLNGTILGAENATETTYTLYILRNGAAERLTRNNLNWPIQNNLIYPYDNREYFLQEPGEYRLMVQSTLDDDSAAITVKSFTITGTRPDVPQVTTDVTEILKDEAFFFEISASGAQRFRWERRDLSTGDVICSYIGTNQLSGDNHNLWQTSVDRTGSFVFRFAACVNNLWSAFSDPISVSVVSGGQMPAPEACVVPETLRAGEPLSVLLEDVPGANTWYVRIEPDSSYFNRLQFSRSGKAEVKPYGLDAGEYTVFISAGGKGYDESEAAEFPLTVTGERPAAPSVTIPSGTHYYSVTYWITMRADGLEGAVNTGLGMTGMYLASGNKVQVPLTLYWNDYASFRAKINGRWTNPFDVHMPCEEQTGGNVLNILSIPGSIRLGEDLPVWIERWDEAVWYTYSVSYLVDDDPDSREQVVYELEFTPDENGGFVIPAQYFTRAGDCDIGVNAYTADYRGKYGSSLIQVTANSDRPAAPVITQITQNPRAFEDVVFEIDAPGASRICLIVKDASCPDAVDDNPVMIETGGQNPVTYVFNSKNFTFYDNSAFLLSASACSYAWSDYCEPVLLVQEEDEEGEIWFKEDEVRIHPDYPCPGNEVTLDWGPAPGAEYFVIRIDGEEPIIIPADQTDNTYTFSTAGMSVGEYTVRVYACAAGRHRGTNYGRFRLYDPESKPTVQTDKAFAEPGEKVTLSIGTREGKTVLLYVNGTFHSWLRRNASGIQTAEMRFTETGTYEIRVCTSDELYAHTGNTLMSDPVTVAVSASAAVPDLVIPPRTVRIESEAFAGVGDVIIWVPATVQEIAVDAFDPSVTIMAPAGSWAAQWAADHGLEVMEI